MKKLISLLTLALALPISESRAAYYFSSSVRAVSFVTAGALATSATVTPISVVSPACNVGDLLICFLLNKELNTAISAPDGTWTPIAQANADCTTAADDFRYAIFWRVATGSGDSFNFSKAADNNVLFAGCIGVWRTTHATVPLDATAVAAQTNVAQADNVTFPAFDPTAANGMAVFVAFYGNDLTAFDAAMSADTDPDCTIAFDLETSAGTDCSIAVTCGQSSGANIAARTWASVSTNDAGSAAVVFALVPP